MGTGKGKKKSPSLDKGLGALRQPLTTGRCPLLSLSAHPAVALPCVALRSWAACSSSSRPGSFPSLPFLRPLSLSLSVGCESTCRPPTTDHRPPTTYHLPPTTYHLPPTTYHLPPTTYRPPTTYPHHLSPSSHPSLHPSLSFFPPTPFPRPSPNLLSCYPIGHRPSPVIRLLHLLPPPSRRPLQAPSPAPARPTSRLVFVCSSCLDGSSIDAPRRGDHLSAPHQLTQRRHPAAASAQTASDCAPAYHVARVQDHSGEERLKSCIPPPVAAQ